MIRINLVPQEILDKEQLRQRNTQLILVAGVLIICVVGLTFVRMNALRKANEELQQANAEYASKWADIGTKLEAKKSAVDTLKTRLGVITDLLTGRALYPHFMADMAQMMPPNVWVTNIITTRDPNSVKVTAQAISSTPSGITRWVRNLEKPAIFGNFGDPTISAITASDDPATTNGKQYAFSITVVYTKRL